VSARVGAGGATTAELPRRLRAPKILVFDSGLGGLTVLREIAALRRAAFTYCADDAAFPYGRLSEAQVVARVMAVMARLIPELAPDLVVIACNTASTLVLGPLRLRFPDLPFVGTVPAIKPAVAASSSRFVSVLATPGTVARDYTRALVREHAGDCAVTLVGATRLARLAENFMLGMAVPDVEILSEIAPCFVEHDGRRTDVVVLACTHYPLLFERLVALAPWRVAFIDPSPAIARRVDHLLASFVREPTNVGSSRAIFTSGASPKASLQGTLRAFGLIGAASVALPYDGAT
jgi:glutamate racemase